MEKAIEQIDPQTAIELILDEPWIEQPDPGAEDKNLPPHRIPRDSAGSYFEVRHTTWTGAQDAGYKSWYCEKELRPKHQEDVGETKKIVDDKEVDT